MSTDKPDAAAVGGATSDPAQPELPVIYATLNVKLPPDEMNKLVEPTPTLKQGETDDSQL